MNPIFHNRKKYRQTRILDQLYSRLSQARQVFVCHSPDPLVCVVKVDEQKLGMPFQFLLMFFGLRLNVWEICLMVFTDIEHWKNILNKTSKLFEIVWECDVNYLFSHHLEEDIKHLITNTNNALHHACEDKEREFDTRNTPYDWKDDQRFNRCKTPTRFIFLDGFVFKVSKHDLEPVGIIGSQHPEWKRDITEAFADAET